MIRWNVVVEPVLVAVHQMVAWSSRWLSECSSSSASWTAKPPGAAAAPAHWTLPLCSAACYDTSSQTPGASCSPEIRQYRTDHTSCPARPPPLASGPAARPVQAVPANVQSASQTCTDVPRWSVSTSGISWQQTETAICTRDDLVVSPTVTHFGARSFAVAEPKAWNHLPADIHVIAS